MTDDLHFGWGVPDGEAVEVPVFHTVITGITRHGKSETMRALAERANLEGYTILLFDVKNPRDYAGLGEEIPIYLEEHTDPTTLKGLLENQSGMGLNFQFSELIKMYEPGDTYHAILERIREAMDEDRHPVEEDKLRVLEHLLSRLADELDKVSVSDDLHITEGAINVMDLHAVDDSIKQLAIAGSVNKVLENHSQTIIGLDEAHNFIPQGKQPPTRDPLVRAIREGAANGNLLWISDQTITGVDKDPLKQVGVWILGKQREKNEAKRVLDQIPGSTSYGYNDVMTLGTGEFIVALDDAQPLAYAQPKWIGDDEAREIAMGEEQADDHEPPETETEEIDMDETLQQKEEQLRERDRKIEELEELVADLRSEKEDLEARIDQYFEGEEGETPDVTPGGDGDEIDEETVRSVVEEYLTEMEIPESLRVDRTIPRLEIHRTVEPAQVNFNTAKGKVLWLYAQGGFPDGWFNTGKIEDDLEARGHNTTVRRTNILNELCQLGFCEARQVGNRKEYRVAMEPEEAEDRGLLVFEEQVA